MTRVCFARAVCFGPHLRSPPKAGVSKDGAKPSPQVRSSSPVIKFETSCFKTRDFVALLTLRGKVGAVAETVIPGRER